MTLLEMSALYAESAAALRRRIGELRQAARELKDEEDPTFLVFCRFPLLQISTATALHMGADGCIIILRLYEPYIRDFCRLQQDILDMTDL